MPNKYWNNPHEKDLVDKEEGAKGKGKVIEAKQTYGNHSGFKNIQNEVGYIENGGKSVLSVKKK